MLGGIWNMFTGILQKLIALLVGLLLVSSAAIIFFRMKNVNRTERTQIFKKAEYIKLIALYIIALIFAIVYNKNV
jgi:hypothetical protein